MEKKYDHQFKIVFDAIKQLLAPPEAKKKGAIGFRGGKGCVANPSVCGQASALTPNRNDRDDGWGEKEIHEARPDPSGSPQLRGPILSWMAG